MSAPLINKSFLNVSFPCYSSNSSLKFFFFCHAYETDTDSSLLINHSFLKDFFKSHLCYVCVEKIRVYSLYTVISCISYNWFKLFMQGQKTGYNKSKISLMLVMMTRGSCVYPCFLNSLCKVTHRFFTHFFFFTDQNYAQRIFTVIY